MMRHAAIALALLVVPAHGQECSMSKAIYTQPESLYELHFFPVDPAVMTSMSTSNMFWVIQPGSDRLLGEVIGNNGVSRPHGYASLVCDGSESASDNCQFCEDEGCLYWDGVMYALGEQTAALLPGETEPAAEVILLPDFGREIRYSDPNFNFSHDPPWDVFKLTGCAP
jgi:hypothetical protein